MRSLGALLLTILPLTCIGEPYSVDKMLSTEGVGMMAFVRDGDTLLLETQLPYAEKPNFGWYLSMDRDRTQLVQVDLRSGKQRTLQGADAGDRVWLGSRSPDGRREAVYWLDGEVAKLGIVDVEAGTLRKLDVVGQMVGMGNFKGPVWISNDEVVLFSYDAEHQTSLASLGASLLIQREIELTRAQAQGKVPSVSESGSGRFIAERSASVISLLRVDVRTGEAKTLDAGELGFYYAVSPDRQRMVVHRKKGTIDIQNLRPVEIGQWTDDYELILHDFQKGTRTVLDCGPRHPTNGTVVWSPDSRSFFYSARERNEDRLVHRNYIYDAESGRQREFAPPGLAFDVLQQPGAYIAPVQWLTSSVLAIGVRGASQSGDATEAAGFRWYAVTMDGNAQSELTARLPGGVVADHGDVFGVFRERLLVMVGGQAWALSASGSPRKLTKDEQGTTFQPWCPPNAPWRGPNPETRDVCRSLFEDGGGMWLLPHEPVSKGMLPFLVYSDGEWTGDIRFVDLGDASSVTIRRPSSTATPVAFDAVNKRVVFLEQSANGDQVLLADSKGQSKQVWTYNRHLAGVKSAERLRLSRREPGEQEDRYDWLLLPPNHQAGKRYPLLVYFYPDTRYGKDYTGDDLRKISYLNVNLAPARGYAVLLASMRMPPWGSTQGNPMHEMHQQLVRAAEHVVAKGYADPERWAILGHSYGGYGTNAVITQTDRFKAAIAMASAANLTSSYGTGFGDLRSDVVLGKVHSRSAVWAETGQGRMGGAPWEVPERFVHNSPIFFADKIKTPLLLLHGTRDFVDITEAEQMFHALHRQGKDAKIVYYWGEGHGIESAANIRDMWRRIFEWLDLYLDVERDERGEMILRSSESS